MTGLSYVQKEEKKKEAALHQAIFPELRVQLYFIITKNTFRVKGG